MADQKFECECGFFNSVDGDRSYTAEEMNRPYKRIISNGVFATPHGTPSTDLQVLAGGAGMQIIVKKGNGLFADKWFENTADLSITVPSNTGTTPRRDSVIVQVDNRVNARKGSIVYRTGTAGSNPIPPTINDISGVTEYRLANIYIAAGASAIGQETITDLRGSGECPWISALIRQPDTSALFEQYEAAYNQELQKIQEGGESLIFENQTKFDEWFRSIKDTIALSTLIRAYESRYISSAAGEIEIPINIPQYNHNIDILQVYINGIRLSQSIDFYINSDTQITLAKPVRENTPVEFVVYKSIDGSDAETVVSLVAALQTSVNTLVYDTGWSELTLTSGFTAYDSASIPAARKYGNTVYLRGAIKGVSTVPGLIATLPESMRPTGTHRFFASAVENARPSAYCMFEIASNGQITLVAKSTTISGTEMLPVATQFILG